MEPAKPPLPMPWNLPFHPEAGIQTSNWISESAEGLMLPATRQNSGISGSGCPAGGVKLPAGESVAEAIAVCGRASDARLSHVAAPAGIAARSQNSVRMGHLLF